MLQIVWRRIEGNVTCHYVSKASIEEQQPHSVCHCRLCTCLFLVLPQNPDLLAPHNWAILYRKNEKTKRLFNRWRVLQIEYSRAGSDQVRYITVRFCLFGAEQYLVLI